MKKLTVVLLIAAGVLLLAVGVAGTIFYVKVYRPIGSPLMAMSGAKRLEEQRLENRAAFLPPESAELSEAQAGNFVAVEEEVQKHLANGTAVLVRNQANLERADDADALSVRTTLLAFQDMKSVYLNAKMTQIDAMNRVHFSKQEFEWVRERLYDAAGLRWSQLDVSEILSGVRDATVVVRHVEPGGRAPEQNQRLSRPLETRLEAWRALAFFGL